MYVYSMTARSKKTTIQYDHDEHQKLNNNHKDMMSLEYSNGNL